MELNWQTVFDRMAKAALEAERLNFIEIVDVLSASYDEIEALHNKDSEDEQLLSLCDQFSERASRRVATIGDWIKKNRVTKTQTQYIVSNYDYKMFYWAKKRGLDKEIDNLQIKIDIDALSDKERLSFESRITVDKK